MSEQGKEEHVLACISASPFSRKIIKTAAQLAKTSGATFSAIYVESGKNGTESAEVSRQCTENTQYAQEMGARLTVTCGENIAAQIVQYARVSGATKVIVGRRPPMRSHLHRRPDIAQQLSEMLPDAEIVIVPNALSACPESGEKRTKYMPRDIGITVGILALTTLACGWFRSIGFIDATLITFYILAVLLISFWTDGYAYGLASSMLSVMIFNFLFTEPRFSFVSYATGYPLTLVVMFLAAFLTSSLTSQVKRQSQQHAKNAYRTEVLLNSNRRLQLAADETGILREAANQVQKLLLRSVLMYPVHDGKLSEPIVLPIGEKEAELRKVAAEKAEHQVAQWVLENNTQGGATTGIYSDAAFWYLAVRMNERPCAIAGVRVEKGESIDAFDKNLLLAMLGECAVALEKERLNRSREEYAFRVRQERIRSDLLRSISHDLRTPLTSISGNANMLLAGKVEDETDRRRLYSDIYDDALWLIGLVENLLSITKMDDGRLKLSLQPEDVSDILDAAISHTQPRSKGHSLRVEKSGELLIVNVDISLIVQLLVNLIENAFKYSGENSTIVVSTRRCGPDVLLCVADDGPGIPDSEKEKVFDMFYSVQNQQAADGRRGLGLGLALCRTIAQAHGGSVCVRDNIPHGAVFELTLPAMEVPNE